MGKDGRLGIVPSYGIAKGLLYLFKEKGNKHTYPFYFYENGLAQKIRLFVKKETGSEKAVDNEMLSRGFALEAMPAEAKLEDYGAEIESWIQRARDYRENLQSLVQTTSIFRKHIKVIEEDVLASGGFPKLVRLPKLVKQGNGADTYKVELVEEEMLNALALKRHIETLKDTNKDRFIKMNSGSKKEFLYMASHHREQAILRYQLEILRKEVVKFSSREQSDSLRKLWNEAMDVIDDPVLRPPKDYTLGFERQLYLSEIAFYLGKARDLGDGGMDATLALRMSDQIDLGLNSANLSPTQRFFRYTLISTPPLAISMLAFWYEDEFRGSLKDTWTRIRSEDGLVEKLTQIEDDEEFLEEYKRAVRARFEARVNGLGVLEFKDPTQENEARTFANKVMEGRENFLGIKRKKESTFRNFLFNPPAPLEPIDGN